MFERLKKFLLEEAGELEDEEEVVVTPPKKVVSDSLEENTNLRRATAIKANKTVLVEPERKVEESSKPIVEPIKERVNSNSSSFKRVDVTPESVELEPKIEEVKTEDIKIQKPVAVKSVKPTVEVTAHRPMPKANTVNPAYYKPKPVISPMFGVSMKDEDRRQQAIALTKPVESESDKTIISPIYGQVTAELEKVSKTKAHKRVSTPRRHKDNVNLSLEEMLNLDNNENLEFTLFDVKVDRDEFQSREMKTSELIIGNKGRK